MYMFATIAAAAAALHTVVFVSLVFFFLLLLSVNIICLVRLRRPSVAFTYGTQCKVDKRQRKRRPRRWWW